MCIRDSLTPERSSVRSDPRPHAALPGNHARFRSKFQFSVSCIHSPFYSCYPHCIGMKRWMQAACSFLKPGAARAGCSRPSRQVRDFYQSAGIQASAFLLIPLSASVRKQDRFKWRGKSKKAESSTLHWTQDWGLRDSAWFETICKTKRTRERSVFRHFCLYNRNRTVTERPDVYKRQP